ncbi:PREDICTED: thiosulfate sulfurtransferase/rhodanese-like domain-containing protein 3 [Vollenhovia emeryi]|uniref:thiosulfate sulfurtransferase/rhodanese-like domain-containing protein 3 n=1 Tax=Vollenhovia emeryi TaxID=411798 RepID=UPI0005F3C0F1|nr:PREDICTED: thiosulfate sulfurtransferase/rhodanese-like domain-containing protein 3 [Vollenhovia emeryi]
MYCIHTYVSLTCFRGNPYALPLAWSRQRFLEITFNRSSAGNDLTRTLHSSNLSCLKRDSADLCKKEMASRERPSILDHLEFNEIINELEGKEETSVWIIDIREPSEINEISYTPESINIPLDVLVKVLKEMSVEDFMNTYKKPKPSASDEIILVCASGRKSKCALNEVKKLNYKNVRRLAGGWSKWYDERITEETREIAKKKAREKPETILEHLKSKMPKCK